METLTHDITDLNEAKRVIAVLSESIARSVRQKNLVGSVVQIQIKYNTFKMISRQITIEETSLTKDIYNAGCSILENNWDQDKPVRLLGISLCSLKQKDMQISFDVNGKQKEEHLEKTIDKLNSKFGQDIIKRGNTI